MVVHFENHGHPHRHGPGQNDPWTLRKKFSVVVEKTARELSGRHAWSWTNLIRQQEICCSRMFGKRLTELAPIKECCGHLHDACLQKLRAQKSYCKKIRVSIRTGMFNPDEAKYAKGVVVTLPYPTDDVRLLTKAAVDALDHVFQQGFRYSKAEVLLGPQAARRIFG